MKKDWQALKDIYLCIIYYDSEDNKIRDNGF